MRIRTNMAAIFACRQNNKTVSDMQKNLQKLSSGQRINNAADDAAGLSISERMRAKITELSRAGKNVKEGLSLTRTADGALAEINDMLCRARNLCIQAANGTYSEQERSAISDELNGLFSEVDRITAGTYFNSICLFRQKNEETEVTEEVLQPAEPAEPEPPKPKPEYKYTETIEALPEGQFEEWGEITFIHTEDFDPAPKAQQAFASARLDDSIQDVHDLVGKGIKVGTTLYYFGDATFTETGTVPGVSFSHRIDITSYKSIDAAMSLMASRLSANYAFRNVQYDSATRTLTANASLNNLNDGPIVVDGKREENQAISGNGAWANGNEAMTNAPTTTSLREVDGYGTDNNKPTYSTTGTVVLTGVGGAGDPTKMGTKIWNQVKDNALIIDNVIIPFTSVGNGANMTLDEFTSKIAAKINTYENLKATFDVDNRTMTITIKGGPAYPTIIERVNPGTPPKVTTTKLFDVSGVTLTAKKVASADVEKREAWEVTLPDLPSTPFSVKINGSNYVLYDSRTTTLPATDSYTRITCSPSATMVDTRDWGGAVGTIRHLLQSNSAVGSVTVDDDHKITVIAKNTNTPLNLTVGTGDKITVNKAVTEKVTISPDTRLIVYAVDGDPVRRDWSVSFHLGATFDKDKLVGSGFSVASFGRIEFTDGPGTGLRDDYTDVDLSLCNSFEDIRNQIATLWNTSNPNSIFAVDLDKSDPGDIRLRVTYKNTSYMSVTDGLVGMGGLLDQDTVSFSGGVNTGYSQKLLDFSSINENNLDTLLGKGFRINCATCEGEYINVFFCWENNGEIPESFQRYDEGTGEMRTIHNIAIELSKVTDGATIVESIVEQIGSSLTHYTALEVGSDPNILIARERRIGDVTDQSSRLRLGKVLTGVRANFRYDVEKKLISGDPSSEDDPEPPSDSKTESSSGHVIRPIQLKTSSVKIYVGSDPKPQFIPIRLPYLDLAALELDSPTGNVDLNDSSHDAAWWLDRVDRANLSISSVRGDIGADENRLGHAAAELSCSQINLTDSESLIRDSDMADLAVKQIKLQILTQAQQAMLSQANAVAGGALQLLS